MNRDTLIEQLPAYAIGALDPAETAEVEALLEADEDARRRLAEYQAISVLLTLDVPLRQPSPDMKRGLLRQLSVEVQAPALVPRARTPKYLMAVAVLFGLLVIGLAALIFAQPSTQSLYQQITGQDGATRIALGGFMTADISGDLAISADGKQAIIRVQNLPPLADDQAFQLWLIDENGSVSGGIFRLAQGEAHYIAIPLQKSVFAYRRFGVSLEPAQGSPLGNRASGPRVFNVVLHIDDQAA